LSSSVGGAGSAGSPPVVAAPRSAMREPERVDGRRMLAADSRRNDRRAPGVAVALAQLGRAPSSRNRRSSSN